MNAKHTREKAIGILGEGEIELEMLIVRIGILDSTFEQNVLRDIEFGTFSGKSVIMENRNAAKILFGVCIRRVLKCPPGPSSKRPPPQIPINLRG